jgi:hypothetical protein
VSYFSDRTELYGSFLWQVSCHNANNITIRKTKPAAVRILALKPIKGSLFFILILGVWICGFLNSKDIGLSFLVTDIIIRLLYRLL